VLRDSLAASLEQTVSDFFAARAVDMLTLTPADFVTVLQLAIVQSEPAETRVTAP
jgi:hypothetical protein